jgi:hypothetical protein
LAQDLLANFVFFSWHQDLLMDDPFLFFFVWAWEDPGPPGRAGPEIPEIWMVNPPNGLTVEDTQHSVALNQSWLARESPIDDFRRKKPLFIGDFHGFPS